MVTVLIAGGGTGGHVFPMLAVGQAIKDQAPDAEVFYVGTERGIETRAVPAAGGELELLEVLPLRGGGATGFVRGAWAAARSLQASRRLILRRKPSVVLSVGGYAAGPVALMARMMGVPLAVLEPNSVIGLTNRLLSPLAARAYTAFSEVESRFPRRSLRRFGVPLRRAFEPAPYEVSPGRLEILVLGGSLGAMAMNERLPAALAALLRDHPQARVTHQAGRGRSAATLAAYRAAGVSDQVQVSEFIDDVGEALRRADLVIARAGASALSEICAVGRASVLVPYPFAVDQHQLRNARSLEAQGAAIVLPQAEMNFEHTVSLLKAIASDGARRVALAKAAAALGRPQAAAEIAEDLLGLAQGRSS